MEYATVLGALGIPPKEQEIYLTLLPLGTVKLQELASRLSYPRTTVYNTLNYLQKKGLVSTITQKKIKHYKAASPDKLKAILKEKEKLLNTVLPDLEKLMHEERNTSSVELFRGQKGLFTILADVFKKKQQTYYFGSYTLSKKILKHQPDHFRVVRLEKNIPAQIVIDPCDEPLFHTKKYKQITKMRFHPGLKQFPCMIFIYGDKVALYTLKKDLIGLIIHNEQVAQAMKLLFTMYWNTAK